MLDSVTSVIRAVVVMVERNSVTMDEEEADSLDVFGQDNSEDFLDSLEPGALLKEKLDIVVGI